MQTQCTFVNPCKLPLLFEITIVFHFFFPSPQRLHISDKPDWSNRLEANMVNMKIHTEPSAASEGKVIKYINHTSEDCKSVEMAKIKWLKYTFLEYLLSQKSNIKLKANYIKNLFQPLMDFLFLLVILR